VTPDELPETPSDTLLQQAIRFLASSALVAVVGAVAFAILVLPAAGTLPSSGFHAATEGRLRLLVVIGAWLLLALALVRITNQSILLGGGSSGGVRLSDASSLLFGTTPGRGLLLQVSAAIALLIGLRAGRRWTALAGIAVALAISASFMGHPAAATSSRGIAITLDAIHVLGAGGWVGSILALTIAAVPNVTLVPAGQRVDVVRGLLRAFSPLALSCAAIAAVSGAAGGWLQLGDTRLILGSEYGIVLVRKVVIVLVIAAVGAYHWRVVQRATAGERWVPGLRASLAIDVAFVLLVLVMTAILTGTSPPVR
jgi:putative copper export protein